MRSEPRTNSPIQIKESKSEIEEESEKEEMLDNQESTQKRKCKMGKGEITNSKLNKKPQKT